MDPGSKSLAATERQEAHQALEQKVLRGVTCKGLETRDRSHPLSHGFGGASFGASACPRGCEEGIMCEEGG